MKRPTLLIAIVLPCTALAQPADTRPSSATTTLGENKVTITVTGGDRVITANGLPNHTTGRFPNRGNLNAITAKNYQFHVPTNPTPAKEPTSASIAWFGVALNGVPFEPGTAEFWNKDPHWNYEAMGATINLGLDQNNAHVQPNGAYHYHGLPGITEEFPFVSRFWRGTPDESFKKPWPRPGSRTRSPGGERPAGPSPPR